MKDLLNVNSEFLTSLGIVDWGYTEESVPASYHQYDNWVKRELHGSLTYLSDHRKDLRSDIKNIYPEFKSALVFLFSYQESKKWMLDNNHNEVAAYSMGFGGEDYHYVLKTRLEKIFDKLKPENASLERFISLDTQPVLERDLALRAGLGWFGKNSMLINQREGSYFIIGSLLMNQKLNLTTGEIDNDHCGQCLACVEACPTNAINPETRTLIASQCISTFTIETFKEAPAPEGFEKSRGEIFGCDICQDVCPWNRKPLIKSIAALSLKPSLEFLKNWFYELPKKDLANLIEAKTNRGLKKFLQGTPFDRPGKIGWLKNLKVKPNQNDS